MTHRSPLPPEEPEPNQRRVLAVVIISAVVLAVLAVSIFLGYNF